MFLSNHVVFALCALFSFGCGVQATDQAKRSFTMYTDCPDSETRVVEIDGVHRAVEGCGVRQLYTCGAFASSRNQIFVNDAQCIPVGNRRPLTQLEEQRLALALGKPDPFAQQGTPDLPIQSTVVVLHPDGRKQTAIIERLAGMQVSVLYDDGVRAWVPRGTVSLHGPIATSR